MKWSEKCIMELTHRNLFENDDHRARFRDLLDCYCDAPFFSKGLCKCMYLSSWDQKQFTQILDVLNEMILDRGNAMNLFLFAFSTGSLIIGLMIAWINIPVTTIMMRIVDRDKLSKVNSIINVGSQAMIPIASVLAGTVLQNFGSTVLLFVCALGFSVTAVLLLMNKPVREL